MTNIFNMAIAARLFVLVLVVVLAAVVTVEAAAYQSIGCSRLGCDAAHSNSVPMLAPGIVGTSACSSSSSSKMGKPAILWSYNTSTSGSAVGGCASDGQLAWCSLQDTSVQFGTTGVTRMAPQVFARPGTVPLVSFAAQLYMANTSTALECVHTLSP